MTYGELLGFLVEECDNTDCEHCVLDETCKKTQYDTRKSKTVFIRM
jgi:hypothetical protein